MTNHDEPVQQANATVCGVPEDPAIVYYQFSNVFGQVTFRLKAEVYKILVQHDTLGNRHRTVNLDLNYDLTVGYTDADEASGGPLSILPQWDPLERARSSLYRNSNRSSLAIRRINCFKIKKKVEILISDVNSVTFTYSTVLPARLCALGLSFFPHPILSWQDLSLSTLDSHDLE